MSLFASTSTPGWSPLEPNKAGVPIETGRRASGASLGARFSSKGGLIHHCRTPKKQASVTAPESRHAVKPGLFHQSCHHMLGVLPRHHGRHHREHQQYPPHPSPYDDDDDDERHDHVHDSDDEDDHHRRRRHRHHQHNQHQHHHDLSLSTNWHCTLPAAPQGSLWELVAGTMLPALPSQQTGATHPGFMFQP